MCNFYANILKAILLKKTTIEGIYEYLKKGTPAFFILLLLCLVFQHSLQAQEVLDRTYSLKSNPNKCVFCNCCSLQQNTTSSKKLYYFAVKNNLIYDAVLLPNLTAEVYLGKQFSLAIEGNWSWWSSQKTMKSDLFYRIQSAGTELRYWFNSNYPLHGHAVGIYSMVGDYDIRLFTKNEDSKGWLSYGSWSAGLSYAYSMPIANRVNLEYGLAVGYLGGKYYEYKYCMPEGHWERQVEHKNMNYFGLTRVGVSIVWLFGNGNTIKNSGSYTKLRKSNNKKW